MEEEKVPPKLSERKATYTENVMNLALIDPSRFGWTASGGVRDLLPPSERARRKGAKKAFLQSYRSHRTRKRARVEGKKTDKNGLQSSQKISNDTKKPGDASLVKRSRTNGICAKNGNPYKSHTDECDTTTAVEDAITIDADGDIVRVDAHATSTNTALAVASDPVAQTTQQPIPSTTEPTKTSTEEKRHVRLRAIRGSTLDIDAFYLGRDGSEARDESTGELLLDTAPVDTNHNLDEPKSHTANVTIKFPLDPDNVEKQYYFTDIIQWDLQNSETPTPMVFAAGIAQDFGLDYATQWDLAQSIQHQLQAFCHEQFAYSTPVLLNTSEKPAPMVPCLYGEMTGFTQEGGVCQPKKAPQMLRAGSVAGGRNTVLRTSSAKGPAKRRASMGESDEKVENVYYEQVRLRLYEASIHEIEARNISNESGCEIEMVEKCECHICRKPKGTCGLFACGIARHSYCRTHLTEQLGLKVSDPKVEKTSLKYCPVCSLECKCPDCANRLDVVARQLKTKCIEQGGNPDFTVFKGILEYSRSLHIPRQDKNKAKAKGKAKKRKSGVMDRRPVVPKLPLSEFPREVVNSKDMDFEYERDYKTIFNAEGSFLVNTLPDNDAVPIAATAQVGEEAVPAEDGNVDFCDVCKKVGNLLCCDFCPRAFHSECVPPEKILKESSDTTKWQCPTCHLEKVGLADDLIDGDSSKQTVYSAFEMFKSEKNFNQDLRLLSILHSMLRALMDYDFGYMFRTPVNCKDIPTYNTIVKDPMDLGTIVSMITKSRYRKNHATGTETLQSIALAVLKDIELVWHNCFIFNVEGSSVYRMAEVLNRRSQSIRRRSFDELLSLHVKKDLAEYVSSLAKARDDFRRLEQPVVQRKAAGGARHKIAGTHYSGTKGRPVAALDPETGMVAKIYTTMNSALNAIAFLQNLQHKCEWEVSEVDSSPKLKTLIGLCREDTCARLYGYRWVFLNDLRNREVVFPPRPKSPVPVQEIRPDKNLGLGLLQMKSKDMTCFFNSIEESLSYPGLTVGISDLRNRLRDLVAGADFTDISGTLWRRFKPETGIRDFVGVQPAMPPSINENATESDPLNKVAYIKEDLIAGIRNLASFPDVDTVFQDWKDTLEASLYAYAGPTTMEIFLSFFLDGDRNIDGICWRSAKKPRKKAPKKKKSPKANAFKAKTIQPTKAIATNDTATASSLRDELSSEQAPPTTRQFQTNPAVDTRVNESSMVNTERYSSAGITKSIQPQHMTAHSYHASVNMAQSQNALPMVSNTMRPLETTTNPMSDASEQFYDATPTNTTLKAPPNTSDYMFNTRLVDTSLSNKAETTSTAFFDAPQHESTDFAAGVDVAYLHVQSTALNPTAGSRKQRCESLTSNAPMNQQQGVAGVYHHNRSERQQSESTVSIANENMTVEAVSQPAEQDEETVQNGLNPTYGVATNRDESNNGTSILSPSKETAAVS